METIEHRQLKRLALSWLRGCGGLAAATEVRCPISRYRVDVAAYVDAAPRGTDRRRTPPRTVVVECKQSRADFLRECDRIEDTLRRRAAAERIRAAIERDRIMHEEPELRREASSLFPELDDWDFASSRLPCYRRVLDRIEQIELTLYGQTKFHRMSRYRLADRMYLAAPRGMIRRCELPRGWGLLECGRDRLTRPDRIDPDEPVFKVTVEAQEHDASERHRTRLLRNIAIAAGQC